MHKSISDYLARNIYPFHMPGHKGNMDFFPENFIKMDLTELPNLDVLSAPEGILRDFQSKIAEKFSADESFFLVNGSSAGIVAAICATCGENMPVFVPRNAHVSVYNGLVLSGANPIYNLPEITSDGLMGGVSSFGEIPTGAVVFVVSPTYEGFVSDIKSIAKEVHKHGGILIVDEAHGAHFSFHEYFPKNALSQGADIVVNSLHKTLPAMSGCAVLHVQGTRINTARLKFFINAMQTTSPSYAMMGSCDYMLDMLWKNPDLFDRYVMRLEKFRRETSDFLSCGERKSKNSIHDIDMGKLLFSHNGTFKSSSEIQFEYVTKLHALAMTSVADTDEGFSRLKKVVCNFILNKREPIIIDPISIPKAVLTPRETMLQATEEIPSKDAIGRVSAEIIAKYPPGIALYAPGELISTQPEKSLVRVVKTR
ncbi:MAG: aminotransferase class I/II-fold pyridoxal phosphate-dependent enzyme [Defluviitaleaceae bacterium]|nr:aminotransferase class I/II-fold pyridoxal phosphate-dependent enzyme [Defluviitaleaceae bacterium]